MSWTKEHQIWKKLILWDYGDRLESPPDQLQLVIYNIVTFAQFGISTLFRWCLYFRVPGKICNNKQIWILLSESFLVQSKIHKPLVTKFSQYSDSSTKEPLKLHCFPHSIGERSLTYQTLTLESPLKEACKQGKQKGFIRISSTYRAQDTVSSTHLRLTSLVRITATLSDSGFGCVETESFTTHRAHVTAFFVVKRASSAHAATGLRKLKFRHSTSCGAHGTHTVLSRVHERASCAIPVFCRFCRTTEGATLRRLLTTLFITTEIQEVVLTLRLLTLICVKNDLAFLTQHFITVLAYEFRDF